MRSEARARLARMIEERGVDGVLRIDIHESADLPPGYAASGRPAYRSLTLNGRDIEFSEGFTELHTAAYREILAGRGFGLSDAKPSVELVYALRAAPIVAAAISDRNHSFDIPPSVPG